MTDISSIVVEVESAYRHYVEVFNRRDPSEIALLYDRPHAQVIGGMGLSVVHDDAGQQDWYEFVMAYLDDQQWGRTEVNEMWVWPLSPTIAHLVADVTRYRADGSLLQQVRANYTLHRRDDTWKVILTLPLLEDGFGHPVVTPAS